MDVKVALDREKYRPGEMATFHLIATDWQGQPVRGAFSVAVVDAALLAIQKEYAPDIRQYFYADRRSQSIQNNASTWSGWQPDTQDQQPAPHDELHQWVVPEGMGELEDWPGDNQLGFPGFGGTFSVPLDNSLIVRGGLVPPNIVGIYAFPLDNSLIVRGGVGGFGGGPGGFGGGGLGGF
ncbi:MAG TPA: hypothetical protein VK132_04705, partial [Gemmatimonadales bacterium]|nr:hypothetical protein [Gemmatimonadales bacterium]